MRKSPSDQPTPSAEPEVVVLGEAAVDWVALVDVLPCQDRIALSSSCQRYPGGSAANVAVGLARLGCRVGFAGQLGDDENGTFLRLAFERDGVDTSGVVEVAGYRTPTSWVAVDGRGEHVIILLPRDRGGYRLSDVDLDRLRRAQGVYIGASDTELACGVAAAARPQATPVFFAPGGLCQHVARHELDPVLDRTDVLFVSRGEAALLARRSSPGDAVRELLAAGPPVVVMTLGSEGALVATRGGSRHVPALPVAEKRDTTGAGDAFAAGFAAALLRSYDLPSAARIGCSVAALKICHLGARTGLPCWADALAAAERQGLAQPSRDTQRVAL